LGRREKGKNEREKEHRKKAYTTDTIPKSWSVLGGRPCGTKPRPIVDRFSRKEKEWGAKKKKKVQNV